MLIPISTKKEAVTSTQKAETNSIEQKVTSSLANHNTAAASLLLTGLLTGALAYKTGKSRLAKLKYKLLSKALASKKPKSKKKTLYLIIGIILGLGLLAVIAVALWPVIKFILVMALLLLVFAF